MGIAYRKAGDVLVIGKGQLRLLQKAVHEAWFRDRLISVLRFLFWRIGDGGDGRRLQRRFRRGGGAPLPAAGRQAQHGCKQGRKYGKSLSHFVSPPACSKIADSSAMSDSVSWRLSTMALIISPRLPP